MSSKEVRQVFIDCKEEMPAWWNDAHPDLERRNKYNANVTIYVDFLAPITRYSFADGNCLTGSYQILRGRYNRMRQEWVHEWGDDQEDAFKRNDVPAWAYPPEAPTFWDKEVLD